MKYVLKFLIHSIRTMDGRRGSADKMLNLMNRQSFEEYQQTHKTTVVPDAS